jgi:hypothetical protein
MIKHLEDNESAFPQKLNDTERSQCADIMCSSVVGVTSLFGVSDGDKKVPFGEACAPLWSSGQSFWLQIHRSWVRFPGPLDFLRSSGSGTGSTQHREDN